VPVLVGATMFGDRQDQGVAFVLDLTQRKRRNISPTGVREVTRSNIYRRRDYRYQQVNPAVERRWGVPAETFVGCT